ncbi:hypothetical protein [Flavobacterium orientale]|uniref:Uncharacterized protein n=1 Tax=Flavobacterium orientale TaxID=1756020 RepID=A0A916Y2I2_9FLAO|nr:hypothetical protein [Flavobacterium orientale]GGD27552.1 hypothetical protein GCM10011343_17180 [Flavobacterium orientale]
MAKIIPTGYPIPKRLGGGLVIYEMDGEYILRTQSGFTSKALKKSAKYANCRHNASEFGRVSKSCKGLRDLLTGILPKENNLAVVNSLTKKMRALLVYDMEHERGQRLLATAFEQEEVRKQLKDYSFNPDSGFVFTTEVKKGRLRLDLVQKPWGLEYVGIRLHVVNYDFSSMEGRLCSGDWHMERGRKRLLRYSFPTVEPSGGGVLLYIVELQSFEELDGTFTPVRVKEKGVDVAGCGLRVA